MDFQLRVKCTTTEATKITDAVLCIDITMCRTNSFDDWVTKCIIMPVGTNQKPEKNMNRDVSARLFKRDFIGCAVWFILTVPILINEIVISTAG